MVIHETWKSTIVIIFFKRGGNRDRPKDGEHIQNTKNDGTHEKNDERAFKKVFLSFNPVKPVFRGLRPPTSSAGAGVRQPARTNLAQVAAAVILPARRWPVETAAWRRGKTTPEINTHVYVHQCCQMAYFQTKNPNLGKFGKVLHYIFNGHFVYFTAKWNTLWPFTYIVHLVLGIFFPFWYLVPRKVW
jgi:hypothetical protein